MQEIQQWQYQDAIQVVRTIVLCQGCFHDAIEQAQLNPYATYDNGRPSLGHCNDACWSCQPNHESFWEINQPVSCHGLTSWLMHFFLHSMPSEESRSLFGTLFIQNLIKFKHPSGQSFLAMVFQKEHKTQPVHEVKLLLLKLFAVGILQPKVMSLQTSLCAVLNCPEDSDLPMLHSNGAWSSLQQTVMP